MFEKHLISEKKKKKKSKHIGYAQVSMVMWMFLNSQNNKLEGGPKYTQRGMHLTDLRWTLL